MTELSTVADVLPKMAERQPDTTAIFFPTKGRDHEGGVIYDEVSYRELDERSTRIAAGLDAVGITRGQRAALMVRPSPDLFALTFAMFKAGVVPVMIDPGLGVRGLGRSLLRARPSAFIGIPAAHVARIALGWGRATVERTVTVGGWGLAKHSLHHVERVGAERVARGDRLTPTHGDEVAAVLFTSGSTGPPKGAVYRHRNFLAQVEAIRAMFAIEPGEIDLPTFPLFALFDPALGMTTVIPDMDPSRPADVDPVNIITPIERFGVTTMFGSPALLNTVGRYGAKHGTKLSTLRRVIAAGAPMPAETLKRWHAMLSKDADVFPPYGATESLPVACMPGRQVLEETWERTEHGHGVCVGLPVPDIDVKIIQITDDPIERFSTGLELPDGEIGEIAVRGPMVTEEYFGDTENTALAKMRDGDSIWHRMGDVGWRDSTGRLWFCGRKSHRVVVGGETMFTVPCEKVFDAHPAVYRSALVGPEGEPTLCVELEASTPKREWPSIERQLREIAQAHPKLRRISRFVRHAGFPVDIRHNAKIGREKLAQWVRTRRVA